MDGQNEIKEIDRLILKYLEGEASKDEKIAFIPLDRTFGGK